jgi:hypothetical protein
MQEQERYSFDRYLTALLLQTGCDAAEGLLLAVLLLLLLLLLPLHQDGATSCEAPA